MGMLVILLCFVLGTFSPVQSTVEEQVASLSQGFFANLLRFPHERHFDIPFDTFFSSWRTSTPGFHLLSELPPHMKVPKIQAFCDSSQVTLLVDKRFNGVELSGDDLQFGDGCYSNGDLENQLVFTYNVSQCGTNYLMQNGLEVFYNNLYFSPTKYLLKWWPTPFTVPISCIPNRSNNNPKFVSMAPPENDWSFAIKAMTSSWTRSESNIYQRGQMVHLQVTARPGPDQRPFIQSCMVSASPDPQTRPRHAVIMNKGCTAPSGSYRAVTQFVDSRREDTINFNLNTSQLSSEVYIHCSVLISHQGITSGSKSCNYNNIQSRWEELNGNVEVCKCCSSRCKGPSLKHLRVAAKAIVSTGPFVIVDKEHDTRPVPSVPEPHDASSIPVANSMQSDTSDPAMTEYQTSSAAQSGSGAPDITDTIASGASFSGSKMSPEAPWSSLPEAVVALSQDPGATLTLWLPGQRQVTAAGLDDKMGSPLESELTVQLQLSDTLANNIPEVYIVATDQDSLLDTIINGIGGKGLNEVGIDAPVWGVNAQSVDGWVIPLPEKAEEPQKKLWVGGSWMPHTEAPLEGYKLQLDENMLNDVNLLGTGVNHERDLLAERQANTMMVPESGTTADLKPVIRSKLQVSKGVDGLQTLSYEEEVVRPEGRKGMSRRFGVDKVERRNQEAGQRGLLSTFLDLLRKLDKAE